MTGQAENAKRYGELCLAISKKELPFYLGNAHETLTRAALLSKDRSSFDEHLNQARNFASRVENADEKKILIGRFGSADLEVISYSLVLSALSFIQT